MPIKINPMPELSEAEKNMFWSKVAFTANPNLCWEWQSSKRPSGHGFFSVKKGTYYAASRISYYLSYKKHIDDLVICHKCDNPKCCNPSHLFSGTQLDNMRDKVNKGRQPIGENHYAVKIDGAQRGSKNNRSKLLEADVIKIRAEYIKNVVTMKMLSIKYNVCLMAISDVLKRRNWKHI